jgi:hypothetical protein
MPFGILKYGLMIGWAILELELELYGAQPRLGFVQSKSVLLMWPINTPRYDTPSALARMKSPLPSGIIPLTSKADDVLLITTSIKFWGRTKMSHDL